MFRSLPALALLAALPLLTLDVSAQARLQGTPSETPTKPAESFAGGGIVQDPSFEAGDPNPFWTVFSENFGTPLCTVAFCGTGGGTGPRTGTWWTWFGGTTAAESGSVEQTVTIPSGTANLTFWLQIPAPASGTGFMRVLIDGTQVFNVTQADAATYASYTQVTVGINAFANGGSHLLRFESTTNAGTVLNFMLDDIQITATPAGPSISVTPPSVNFGGVQVGSSSSPQTVTITNNGSATLTLSAITVAGAGFSINTTGTSMSLAPAASTTFTATYTPTTTGPQSGAVTITSNAPGSPTTVPLSGTGQNFQTYASTDTPLPVPDCTGAGTCVPGAVVSTIVVPAGAPNIGDLDVAFHATHSWAGDLAATVSKGATSVTFYDRPGVPGSTFGCSGDNPNIIADDEGTNGSIETGCTGTGTAPAYPVVGGRYTPNSPLSVFDGMSAVGTWTLTVTDNAAGDTGSLTSWALLVTPGGVSSEGAPSAGAFRLAVAPNPVVGSGQATLTVSSSQDVRVSLYDVLGREVRVLFEGAVAAGQQAYIGFPTSGLAPGAYVVRASGEGVEATERVTVVR